MKKIIITALILISIISCNSKKTDNTEVTTDTNAINTNNTEISNNNDEYVEDNKLVNQVLKYQNGIWRLLMS